MEPHKKKQSTGQKKKPVTKQSKKPTAMKKPVVKKVKSKVVSNPKSKPAVSKSVKKLQDNESTDFMGRVIENKVILFILTIASLVGVVTGLYDFIFKQIQPKESSQVSHTIDSPVVRFQVLKKKSLKDNWTPAADISSGNYYQVRVRSNESIYLYGFQQDSSNNFQKLFPEDDFKNYSFENPVKKDKEYFIPHPRAGFQLDNVKGMERFYFFYSKSPVSKPLSVLKKHLDGSVPLEKVILKKLQHK